MVIVNAVMVDRIFAIHRNNYQRFVSTPTQYETAGWYERINPDPEQDSPIADAIMDRIINNAYVVSVDGKISMRERHGIKASANRKAGE